MELTENVHKRKTILQYRYHNSRHICEEIKLSIQEIPVQTCLCTELHHIQIHIFKFCQYITSWTYIRDEVFKEVTDYETISLVPNSDWCPYMKRNLGHTGMNVYTWWKQYKERQDGLAQAKERGLRRNLTCAKALSPDCV